MNYCAVRRIMVKHFCKMQGEEKYPRSKSNLHKHWCNISGCDIFQSEVFTQFTARYQLLNLPSNFPVGVMATQNKFENLSLFIAQYVTVVSQNKSLEILINPSFVWLIWHLFHLVHSVVRNCLAVKMKIICSEHAHDQRN